MDRVISEALGLKEGLGDTEGLKDGDVLGEMEGEKLGEAEGDLLGEKEGDGDNEGLNEGDTDGDFEGLKEGLKEGLGDTEGLKDGDAEGDFDGEKEGDGEGDTEGDLEGEKDLPAIKYLGIGYPYFSNHQQRWMGFQLDKNFSSINHFNTQWAKSVLTLIVEAINLFSFSNISFSQKWSSCQTIHFG